MRGNFDDDIKPTEKMEEKHPKKCCWNCKYYILPKQHLELDGPISSICTIDRKKDVYADPVYMQEGDKERSPGEVCDRWKEREFDEEK